MVSGSFDDPARRQAGVWGVVVGVFVATIALTDLGPAVVVWGGHGLHVGDVIALVLAVAGAWWLSRVVASPTPDEVLDGDDVEGA